MAIHTKKKKSSRSESINIFLLKYPVPPYSLPEGWQYIWSISVTAPRPTFGVTVIFPWSLLSAMILCSHKTSIHYKKFWKYRKRDENHLHNQRYPKHVTVRNEAWFSITCAPPQLITLKTFFYAIKQFFRPSFKSFSKAAFVDQKKLWNITLEYFYWLKLIKSVLNIKWAFLRAKAQSLRKGNLTW